MVNWAIARRQFEHIVAKNGIIIQWLERTSSGSGAYDPTNTTTFGYGDVTTYWITGSVRAIIEEVRVQDILLEAGFYPEDYKNIYVSTNETLEQWDQIIYPSGSGIRYLIYPVHYWEVGNSIVSKYAMIRKLLPRSGSVY